MVVGGYWHSEASSVSIQWHDEERSHLSRSVRMLHLSFVLTESPLQHPGGAAVVVGVSVVVSSQSPASSVSIHSHPLLLHCSCAIALEHLSLALYESP